MNITLNGTGRTVAGDSSIAALVSEVTGRPLAADGRATDGRKMG